MDTYIVITKQFAEALKGIEGEESNFGYAITKDGRYVCSVNSVNDYPEQFAAIEPYETVELGIDDFPIHTLVCASASPFAAARRPLCGTLRPSSLLSRHYFSSSRQPTLARVVGSPPTSAESPTATRCNPASDRQSGVPGE